MVLELEDLREERDKVKSEYLAVKKKQKLSDKEREEWKEKRNMVHNKVDGKLSYLIQPGEPLV